MNNNKKILGKVIYVITLLFLLVILYIAYEYYQSNNFNDFIRSEKILYTSKFKCDNETKYSHKSSYKISSDEFNRAGWGDRIGLIISIALLGLFIPWITIGSLLAFLEGKITKRYKRTKNRKSV